MNMKTLIFLFFTYITYVLSSVAGPLGFAAEMPPFDLLEYEEGNLQRQSIDGHYGEDDLILFLLEGHTDHCVIYLQHICKEIKDVFSSFYYFGHGLGAICEEPDKACRKYPQLQKKMCNFNEFENYKRGLALAQYLNSAECRDIYTMCLLRSPSCSSDYRKHCQKILSLCNSGYRDYQLRHLFTDLAGGYADPDFNRRMKDMCNMLYNYSDGFIQYCLNDKRLVSDLKWFEELEKKGLGDFYRYPELSSSALLNARRLDAKLFTPPGSHPDSRDMMAFLISQVDGSTFKEGCRTIYNDCLGLRFFPHTKHICDMKSMLPKSDPCEAAYEYVIKTRISKLRKELTPLKETLEASPKVPYKLKVHTEICSKYSGPCSYLRDLEPEFAELCQNLENQCAQALETGSALSILEVFLRGFVSLSAPRNEQDPCELGLREMCHKIANYTADFLTFCLKPKHTCQTLRSLIQLRCQKSMNTFNNPNPTEEECINNLFEYKVYTGICKFNQDYDKFAALCMALYSSNEVITDYFTSNEKLHHASGQSSTGRGDSYGEKDEEEGEEEEGEED